MSAMAQLHPAIATLTTMAEAVGFTVHQRPDGTVILAREGVTIPIYASKRNWGADALERLYRKILRYGEPGLVRKWRAQEARLNPKAKKIERRELAGMTQRLEVPEHLVHAVLSVPASAPVVAEVAQAAPADPAPPADQQPMPEQPTGGPPMEPQREIAHAEDGSEARTEPVNMATLIRFFRARPGRMVLIDELAEHYPDKSEVTIRNGIRSALNRSLSFRDALVVHVPGNCWEWVEDGAPEPALQSVDLAQAKDRIAELSTRVAGLEESLQIAKQMTEETRAELSTARTEAVMLRERLERIAESALEGLG